MIPDDQIRFVYEFLGDIEKEIVEEIRAGKVPEDFSGIQLKWLIEKKVAERINGKSVTPGLRRDFLNVWKVRNL